MVFSDDFCIITDGEFRSFDSAGTILHTDQYPSELRYWRRRDCPTDVVGCVFVQGDRAGLASYHFPAGIGISGAYISYEAAPMSWLLDNGQPPSRCKPFLNPTYDADTRTFRGDIEWTESSFGGDVKWQYTMVFAADFSSIESGQVLRFRDADSPHTGLLVYGHHLNYKLYVEEEALMISRLQQLGIGVE
jgi:hypothetical protein